MKQMTRRYPVLAIVGGSVLVAIFLLRSGVDAPADNSLTGQTEAAVRSRYGNPKVEFPGHYGNPGSAWTQTFHAPVKTEVFDRLSGNVYVSFENRGGAWIVICNQYLPHGGVF